MTDEEAAEAYAEKHNQPFLDYDCLTDEEMKYYHDRMSCDGCPQNKIALKFAFLAGVEHGRKDSEKREREVWEAGRDIANAQYQTIDDWKKDQEG